MWEVKFTISGGKICTLFSFVLNLQMQKKGKKGFATTNYTDVYLATDKNTFIFKIVIQKQLFSQIFT